MSHAADFLIVQHVADLFRREARNVGVVVRLHGQTDGRFFGETDSGKIDGNQTKSLPYPGIYAQWVRYWRRTMSTKNGSAWDEILSTASGNYQILKGGSIDRIGEDSIQDVTRFLYAALVSEGGMASALGALGEDEAVMRLTESINVEFKKIGVLQQGGRKTLMTPAHPVIQNSPVRGRKTSHNFSWVQRGKHTAAMEPIDLGAKRNRKGMRWHAGWAASAFEDVKEYDETIEAIAIITGDSDRKSQDAKYARAMLEDTARIVNWFSDSDRREFLMERKKLAVA